MSSSRPPTLTDWLQAREIAPHPFPSPPPPNNESAKRPRSPDAVKSENDAFEEFLDEDDLLALQRLKVCIVTAIRIDII
jgi:hypothetical protein